jgi:hypothetical protein
MSDLAPFVAAVIRDRVVAELKDENEALRQENAALKLERHKHNPSRSVKVTGSNGTEIFAENEIGIQGLRFSALSARISGGRKFSFCNPAGCSQPDVPRILWFKCGSWLTLELWIDGGSSVRLQDLSFHYTSYTYASTDNTDDGGWKYVALIEARDGADLNLEVCIFISPDDHAKLLNREQSVDFLPPAERENDRSYIVEHSLDQEIPLSHLSELCGEKEAVVSLNKWMFTKGWFVQHLMVPYVRH